VQIHIISLAKRFEKKSSNILTFYKSTSYWRKKCAYSWCCLGGGKLNYRWRQGGRKLNYRWHLGGRKFRKLNYRWRPGGRKLNYRWRHGGRKLNYRWRPGGGKVSYRWRPSGGKLNFWYFPSGREKKHHRAMSTTPSSHPPYPLDSIRHWAHGFSPSAG
jgi:hypothetical protein